MTRSNILALIIITILNSCNGTPEKYIHQQDKKKQTNDTTINIPCIEPFIQITSIGNVDIEYAKGEYGIQATGYSDVIDLLETTFDSGILTIGMRNETRIELSTIKSKQNIRLYITSPELKYLAICGNGNFTSNGIIQTESFQTGNFASGRILIDSIKCNNFKFESNDIGNTTVNHVHCNHANISTFGSSETNITLDAQKNISLFTGGNSTNNIKAETELLEIFSSNKSTGIFDIECTDLNVIAKNNSTLTFKGRTKNKNFKKDFGCKIDLFNLE